LRILLYSILFLLNISLNIYLFLFAYEKNSKQEQFFSTYKLTKDELSLINDGDIILRHGFGLVSDMIVKVLDEEYDLSHCALVRITDKSYKVIHSVSRSLSDYDGVQEQSLPSFIRESHENSIIIVRLKANNPAHNAQVSDRAQYYLDQKIPFDNAFDITDTSEFYCTELLWKSILDVTGIDILENADLAKKEHLKFRFFLDTALFEIVLNHHERKP